MNSFKDVYKPIKSIVIIQHLLFAYPLKTGQITSFEELVFVISSRFLWQSNKMTFRESSCKGC